MFKENNTVKTNQPFVTFHATLSISLSFSLFVCLTTPHSFSLSLALSLSLSFPALLIPSRVFWIKSTPKVAWKSTLIGIYYMVAWHHHQCCMTGHTSRWLYFNCSAHSARCKYANHMLQAAKAITYCVINLFSRLSRLAALSFALGAGPRPKKQ